MRTMALHRQLYQGSELGAAAVLGCRKRQTSSTPLDDALQRPVSPIPLTKATLAGLALLRSCNSEPCFSERGVWLARRLRAASVQTRVLPRAIDNAAAPMPEQEKSRASPSVRSSFGVLAALLYEAAFAFSSSRWMRLAASISHSASLSRASAISWATQVFTSRRSTIEVRSGAPTPPHVSRHRTSRSTNRSDFAVHPVSLSALGITQEALNKIRIFDAKQARV